jgi:hypothetical protein
MMSKRFLITLALVVAFALMAPAQLDLQNLGTIADITGTGATVQACASCNNARWIQISTPGANTAVVRWGDANTSVSRGSLIAPGGGQYLHPDGGPYFLPRLYLYVASGDKVSITYGF